MPGSVIVGGARTPIGKLSGALTDIPAVGLGGFAISAALHKAGITGCGAAVPTRNLTPSVTSAWRSHSLWR